ncbi:hypothetical protein ACO0SA_002966 [Hanseniaspora valbyensis]
MSIFKESADENLVQARHILDTQLLPDNSIPRNCLSINDKLPKVKFVRDISNDEFFKKLIIIPEKFSKLFLKPIEKYKEKEDIEGRDIFMEIAYLDKEYKVNTFSNKNCKLPIKKRTKILVIDEAFPPIVKNEITLNLIKSFKSNQDKYLSQILAISTSNQVENMKFFNNKSEENLSNCEFVSSYIANLIAYSNKDLKINMSYLILPSEGPVVLPKINFSEISQMCEQLKKSFNIEDAKFETWKEYAIKMWKIMDGESVNSLYL